MGYWSPSDFPSIQNYDPDDGPDHFYLTSFAGLDEIIRIAQLKWGADLDLETIQIEACHIHTRCLTYDLHDPGDYDDFLLITRSK